MLCLGQLLKTICNLSKYVLCDSKLPQWDLGGRRRSHPRVVSKTQRGSALTPELRWDGPGLQVLGL